MIKIKTQPTVEPLSLAEVKRHLRIDSGTFADNLTTTQSIVPGSHNVAAAYSLVGTAVDVLGYNTIVNFVSGTNGGGGTVDVKLQHSDDNVTYADVTSGAFTQVTTVNDNATYEKAYTGGKHYLRVVCTVGVAACEFGVNILKYAPTSAEDDTLTLYITAARKWCEDYQHRAYITQTWYSYYDCFPDRDYIELPLPPLTSVTSITYYDTEDTEATFSSSSYLVDTISEPGRICLDYGQTWPQTTLRPYNGVCIEYICGYGATSSSVPDKLRQAMLLLIAHWYENREPVSISGAVPKELPFAVEALLDQDRIYTF